MTNSIDNAIQRVSKINLSGGLVGRVCTVIVVACVALGSIGVMAKSEWIMGGAVVAILLVVIPLSLRIIGFAEKNPGVALLDGAQLLKHEQLRLASKNKPEILVGPQTQREGRAITVSDEQAELPDPAVTPLLPRNTDKGGD